jgi:hypothetical protein
MALTADRLRELLHYEPGTGFFTWRIKPCRRVNAGAVAGGWAANGYRQIRVDRVKYRAHRLAWLYVHGVWPQEQMDHLNGDRADNRLENIRPATSGENMQNLRGPKRNNTTGFLGVRKHGSRYRADIKTNGKRELLGVFATAAMAGDAYLTAKRQRHAFCVI